MYCPASFGVIIPAYQSSRYIAKAVESIFSQTLLPSEILISDDGSSDGTADIVSSLALDAPVPVRFVVNQRPAGITENYLNALRFLSPCDFVAVADHDDVWLPERLQVIYEAFQANKSISLVCCDSFYVDSNLAFLGGTVRGGWKKSNEICLSHQKIGSFASFLKGKLPCLAHTLVFSYALKHVLLSKPASVSEWYFEEWVTSMAACYGDLLLLPMALTAYRRHSQQVTSGLMEQELNFSKSSIHNSSVSPASSARLQKLLFCRETLVSVQQDNASLHNHENKLIGIDQCISFHRERIRLHEQPMALAQRILIILTLLITRGYHRYASGLRSAAKDLVSISY
jgi:glycosyltransferase involved in cell wall biosynthesis